VRVNFTDKIFCPNGGILCGWINHEKTQMVGSFRDQNGNNLSFSIERRTITHYTLRDQQIYYNED
jgi:hypothetical protein